MNNGSGLGDGLSISFNGGDALGMVGHNGMLITAFSSNSNAANGIVIGSANTTGYNTFKNVTTEPNGHNGVAFFS